MRTFWRQNLKDYIHDKEKEKLPEIPKNCELNSKNEKCSMKSEE